jgi:hypothetical protein
MVTPGCNGQWRVKLGRWGERAKMPERGMSTTKAQQRQWQNPCPWFALHYRNNNHPTMVAVSGSRRMQRAIEGKVRERVERGKRTVGRGAQQSQCHWQNQWEWKTTSEVQNKIIFMGHQILSCHVTVVGSFFDLVKMLLSSQNLPYDHHLICTNITFHYPK